MLTGLFQSTTIPVLQEVVSFSQARHAVLAGNIANIDTPGYQARDLSVEDFQARLKQAIEDRDQPPIGSPGETQLAPKPLMAEVAKSSKSILRHDMGNVDMESQVSRDGEEPHAAQFGAYDPDRPVPPVADGDSWNGLRY